MPNFAFKARNANDALVEGVRSASSEKELVAALSAEGLIVFSVTRASGRPAAGETVQKVKARKVSLQGGAVKATEIAVFCRQMATLINAGVNILDAIEDLSEMVTNRTFQKVLRTIASDIREGSTLSDAMRKHSVFSRVFVAMIAAGERSGKLGGILIDLSQYLEASVKLKRKVTAASSYPAFVGVFFVFVLSGIVFFLIPRFAKLFSSLGADLPLPTKIVMGISGIAVHNAPLILLVLAVLAVGTVFTYRSSPGRMFFDGVLLRLPLFGDLMLKVVFARFFQTMSTLLRSGVDIVSSLEIAAKVANNVSIEIAINGIRSRMIEGATLSGEMGKDSLFPRMVVRMTAVGEKSGKLDDMFTKLSEYYGDEVDAKVAVLSSLIEPILIVFLGAVVGVAVIAMYLPIFKLAGAISGGPQ